MLNRLLFRTYRSEIHGSKEKDSTRRPLSDVRFSHQTEPRAGSLGMFKGAIHCLEEADSTCRPQLAVV